MKYFLAFRAHETICCSLPHVLQWVLFVGTNQFGVFWALSDCDSVERDCVEQRVGVVSKDLEILQTKKLDKIILQEIEKKMQHCYCSTADLVTLIIMLV